MLIKLHSSGSSPSFTLQLFWQIKILFPSCLFQESINLFYLLFLFISLASILYLSSFWDVAYIMYIGGVGGYVEHKNKEY